ncbi:hypothetical protein L1887_17527 [Cichorium endivia]|nr:hypothetical protein L1887_17527 [Cichorium endivia]
MRNSILRSKRNNHGIISGAKKKFEGVIANAAMSRSMTIGAVVSSESLNGENGGISMESAMAEGMVVDVDLSDYSDGETVEVAGFVGVEAGYGDVVMIVSMPPACCWLPSSWRFQPRILPMPVPIHYRFLSLLMMERWC